MGLQAKNILIGVCGGIGAYKCAELVRLLREENANVQVVMTEGAKQFVTPLTFQALSGRPVRDDLWSLAIDNAMTHIELARFADLIVIAPATADTMAQLAYGLAGNLLTTICLASNAPKIIVPAMNKQMWHNTITESNVKRLIEHQFQIWGPVSGEQACGDVGFGRMLEPDEILLRIKQYAQPQKLIGKKIMITAGPTREALDPTRYITNFSSGKMGYALAKAAKALGAEVILISGPTALTAPTGVKFIGVESAIAMQEAVLNNLKDLDAFIGSAAVADYRPEHYAKSKIKKSKENLTVNLVSNPDIIAEVAQHKERPSIVVGFAAESENVVPNAKEKLQRKKLDMVIANEVGEGKGFEVDDNQIWIVTREQTQELPKMSKQDAAYRILEAMVFPR